MNRRYALLAIIALVGLVGSGLATRPAALPDFSGSTRVLSDAELSSARGAGSTCRYGCNEDPYYCVSRHTRIWYPHWECAWAFGADTCIPGQDAKCNKDIWYSDDDCQYESSSVTQWSSTCGPDYIPWP